MKKIIIAVIVIIALIVIFGGNKKTTTTNPTTVTVPTKVVSKDVTMEQFNKVTEGMTYQEVVGILGSEGTVLSSSNMAGYKTVVYQWNGASFGGNMNGTFQNDKLIMKAQFGLK